MSFKHDNLSEEMTKIEFSEYFDSDKPEHSISHISGGSGDTNVNTNELEQDFMNIFTKAKQYGAKLEEIAKDHDEMTGGKKHTKKISTSDFDSLDRLLMSESNKMTGGFDTEDGSNKSWNLIDSIDRKSRKSHKSHESWGLADDMDTIDRKSHKSHKSHKSWGMADDLASADRKHPTSHVGGFDTDNASDSYDYERSIKSIRSVGGSHDQWGGKGEIIMLMAGIADKLITDFADAKVDSKNTIKDLKRTDIMGIVGQIWRALQQTKKDTVTKQLYGIEDKAEKKRKVAHFVNDFIKSVNKSDIEDYYKAFKKAQAEKPPKKKKYKKSKMTGGDCSDDSDKAEITYRGGFY